MGEPLETRGDAGQDRLAAYAKAMEAIAEAHDASELKFNEKDGTITKLAGETIHSNPKSTEEQKAHLRDQVNRYYHDLPEVIVHKNEALQASDDLATELRNDIQMVVDVMVLVSPTAQELASLHAMTDEAAEMAEAAEESKEKHEVKEQEVGEASAALATRGEEASISEFCKSYTVWKIEQAVRALTAEFKDQAEKARDRHKEEEKLEVKKEVLEKLLKNDDIRRELAKTLGRSDDQVQNVELLKEIVTKSPMLPTPYFLTKMPRP